MTAPLEHRLSEADAQAHVQSTRKYRRATSGPKGPCVSAALVFHAEKPRPRELKVHGPMASGSKGRNTLNHSLFYGPLFLRQESTYSLYYV